MYSISELNAFLSGLNLARTSINSYAGDAQQFCAYIKSQHIDNLSDVTKSDIQQYYKVLSENGAAAASILRKRAAIKRLYDFLQKTGQASTNPVSEIKLKKAQQTARGILTKKETAVLMSVPSHGNASGIRDKAMLGLVLATGLKVTELINLRVDNICFKSRHMTVVRQNTPVCIPLSETVCADLQRYISVRNTLLGDSEADALFLNVHGQALSRQGFWKLLKKYAVKADLKNVMPETLRRTFAFHYVKEGYDIHQLQQILGHSDIATTRLYLKNVAK